VEERLEPTGARFEGRVDPQDRQVGVGRITDHLAQPGGGGRRHVLDVDRLVAGQWQCRWPGVGGGEPNDRRPLGGLAFGDEVGGADRGHRMADVQEGLVEQPEHELLPQEPADRLVDALLADSPGAGRVEHQLRPGLPAELVTSGLDDLDDPVELAEVLHAPGASRHRLAHDDAVADQSPVGADDAVEVELVAQVEPPVAVDGWGPIGELCFWLLTDEGWFGQVQGKVGVRWVRAEDMRPSERVWSD
jgi:hypothetical protein